MVRLDLARHSVTVALEADEEASEEELTKPATLVLLACRLWRRAPSPRRVSAPLPAGDACRAGRAGVGPLQRARLLRAEEGRGSQDGKDDRRGGRGGQVGRVEGAGVGGGHQGERLDPGGAVDGLVIKKKNTPSMREVFFSFL